LRNRNDLLRFRFLLWKRFGSGFGSGSYSGQNIASLILEAAVFPRKLASLTFYFSIFVLHFMLDLGPNPVQEPECITVPVPLPQKVAVPAIPAPVPQVTTTLEKANFFS
jgi:hypothetical protein